jgi:hypothetical protein
MSKPARTKSQASIAAQAVPAEKKSWRDVFGVHPVADLFPLMKEESPDELRALSEDIKVNGLQNRIVIWEPPGNEKCELFDGRNRLDALELAGLLIVDEDTVWLRRPDGTKCQMPAKYIDAEICEADPYALAISLNIRRRHLTAERKRELIIEIIARAPKKSDRQIGKEIGVDHKTIARARAKGEDVGRIPHVETRTDTKGREQPAAKPAHVTAAVERVIASSEANRRRQTPAGNDSDPQETAARRKAEALTPSSAMNGSPPISDPVKEINAFHREAVGFLSSFTGRFDKWHDAGPPLTSDGKAALMQAFYLCSDGFARLAQKLDGR